MGYGEERMEDARTEAYDGRNYPGPSKHASAAWGDIRDLEADIAGERSTSSLEPRKMRTAPQEDGVTVPEKGRPSRLRPEHVPDQHGHWLSPEETYFLEGLGAIPDRSDGVEDITERLRGTTVVTIAGTKYQASHAIGVFGAIEMHTGPEGLQPMMWGDHGLEPASLDKKRCTSWKDEGPCLGWMNVPRPRSDRLCAECGGTRMARPDAGSQSRRSGAGAPNTPSSAGAWMEDKKPGVGRQTVRATAVASEATSGVPPGGAEVPRRMGETINSAGDKRRVSRDVDAHPTEGQKSMGAVWAH